MTKSWLYLLFISPKAILILVFTKKHKLHLILAILFSIRVNKMSFKILTFIYVIKGTWKDIKHYL